MFDELIIEEIRKRQIEEHEERPYLELPVPEYIEVEEDKESEQEPKRVIVIDLCD